MPQRYDPGPHPPLTRSGWAGAALHVLLAAAGWLVFGVFTYRVFLRTPPDESAVGVLVVAILLVVSVSLTVAWIRHNLVLARRHAGRRRLAREERREWSHDILGRSLAGPPWSVLQAASEVEIDVDPRSGRKQYREF